MKNIFGIAAVLTGVSIAAVTFGSGVAFAADPLVGKTYSAASSIVAGWGSGGKAVIATVSGSEVSTADCIVTSWHKSLFRDSSGTARPAEFLVNLDCNRPLAAPGHPGNSAMSEQGKAAKKDEADATYVAKNPKVCDKDANTAKWCEDLCTKTGLCEFTA